MSAFGPKATPLVEPHTYLLLGKAETRSGSRQHPPDGATSAVCFGPKAEIGRTNAAFGRLATFAGERRHVARSNETDGW